VIVTLQRRFLSSAYTVGDLTFGEVAMVTMEQAKRSGDLLPAGQYVLCLDRSNTELDDLYEITFGGSFHRGLLCLQDETHHAFRVGSQCLRGDGSILVGLANNKGSLSESMNAYREMYPLLRDAIESGAEVMIDVREDDQ
jgi:hypothetical protein